MLIFFVIIVFFAEIWIHESMQLTLVSKCIEVLGNSGPALLYIGFARGVFY